MRKSVATLCKSTSNSDSKPLPRPRGPSFAGKWTLKQPAPKGPPKPRQHESQKQPIQPRLDRHADYYDRGGGFFSYWEPEHKKDQRVNTTATTIVRQLAKNTFRNIIVFSFHFTDCAYMGMV